MRDADVKTHPAYCTVTFHRVTGDRGKFFGSSIDVQAYIELRVHRAELHNDGGLDHVYAEPMPLIEVALTPSQFAELLTTMNVGSGVPGTLTSFNKKVVEGIPDDEQVEAQRIKTKFKERMRDLSKEMDGLQVAVKQLMLKKSISKADREKLIEIFERHRQEIQSNIPFFLELFDESATKIVSQKKAEVDAFITNSIQVAGLKAISGKTIDLLEEKK